MNEPNGSLTDLTFRIAEGDQSAINLLWERVQTRLLKRSRRIRHWSKIDSTDAKQIAENAFQEVVGWLRSKGYQGQNRFDLWSMLDRRAFDFTQSQRNLPREQSDLQSDSTSCFDQSVHFNSFPLDFLFELEKESQELQKRIPDVDVIVRLLIDGNSLCDIQQKLDKPSRTIERSIYKIREELKRRTE